MSAHIVKHSCTRNDIIVWDGSLVTGTVIEAVKNRNFVYWKVLLSSPKSQIEYEHWVIRRMITDRRPIISERLKVYCKLKTLGMVTMKYQGRLYALTKSRDPNVSPELPLNIYVKNKKLDDIPMYIQRQIQQIYSFRQLLGMTNNIDSSLILRVYRSQIRVYSIVDTFPPIKKPLPKNLQISETIFNRWFDTRDYNTLRTTHYYTANLIGINRDDEENYTQEDFEDSLERFDVFLTSTIKDVDPDLLWFHGDIIKLIIQKATP